MDGGGEDFDDYPYPDGGGAAAGGGAGAGGGGGGFAFAMDDEGVREQDRFLPVANIARIMKRVLPANEKIAKDSKEAIQECVSEFISFITSEASDRCVQERRKTINGEDLLWAMGTLGFDEYNAPLKLYLQKYRLASKSGPGSAGQEGGAGAAGSAAAEPPTYGPNKPEWQAAYGYNVSVPTDASPAATKAVAALHTARAEKRAALESRIAKASAALAAFAQQQQQADGSADNSAESPQVQALRQEINQCQSELARLLSASSVAVGGAGAGVNTGAGGGGACGRACAGGAAASTSSGSSNGSGNNNSGRASLPGASVASQPHLPAPVLSSPAPVSHGDPSPTPAQVAAAAQVQRALDEQAALRRQVLEHQQQNVSSAAAADGATEEAGERR